MTRRRLIRTYLADARDSPERYLFLCKFKQPNRRIGAVKDRRIGVWFSVALVILAFSAWVGSKVGARAAAYRYRADQNRTSEHAHLALVSDELYATGLLRLQFLVSPNDDKLKKTLPDQVKRMESFRQKTNSPEAKPVIDMNLALGEVVTAITEERFGHKEQAVKYMEYAQSLFQSLGWQDFSEGTLRAVAERELDHWKLHPSTAEHVK
jgi:hypothetical protein